MERKKQGSNSTVPREFDTSHMSAPERLEYHGHMQQCYPITNALFERHALAVEAALTEIANQASQTRHTVLPS